MNIRNIYKTFLFAAVSVAAFAFSSGEMSANETIGSGISIAGTDVSGMNADEAKKVLDDYISKYNDVVFELKAEDKSVEATPENLGLSIRNSDVVDRALSFGTTGNILERYSANKLIENGGKKDYALSLAISETSVEEFLKNNESDLVTSAVDATLTRENGEFVFVAGTKGVKILHGKSATAIAKYIATDWSGSNCTIELETEIDEPRGSAEELAEVKDLMGSYNTYVGDFSSARGKNIALAATFLNGKIVYPGETLATNEVIGPTDASRGYLPAGSYENGTVVDSYGGGVCQISTTFYNAVIRAELEVVQRMPHSMVVGYVEPSMDAAIADGYKDFVFKNDSNYPIFVEAYTSGGRLYFNVYGKDERPAGRTVEFVSEILETTDPGQKYIVSADQPVGYLEKTTSAHIGYKAKLWKIVYENGKEVSREQFNTSNYKAAPAEYTVGIAGADEGSAAAITAAAATNDPAIVEASVAAGVAAQQAAANSTPAETPAETPASPEAPAEPTPTPGEGSGSGTGE